MRCAYCALLGLLLGKTVFGADAFTRLAARAQKSADIPGRVLPRYALRESGIDPIFFQRVLRKGFERCGRFLFLFIAVSTNRVSVDLVPRFCVDGIR